MCFNCYHIKITFCYKVISDSKKKKSKVSDWSNIIYLIFYFFEKVIDQTFDWLSSHLVYYLYILY